MSWEKIYDFLKVLGTYYDLRIIENSFFEVLLFLMKHSHCKKQLDLK